VDRYIYGSGDGLSDQARRGLRLFRGKARCANCHIRHIFTDEDFHNTGVAWSDGEWLDDGRFGVTGEETDRGRFKTPTLREVARTAPYMHDGSLATLEDVVDFYNRGGNPNPYLDPILEPLDLSPVEKEDLVVFLRALTGRVQEGR
jgi:cytochrome c peroxidase